MSKEFPSEVLKDVFLAGATAFFTVRMALSKFRVEQWWQTKRESYGRLMGALWHFLVVLRQIRSLTSPFPSPIVPVSPAAPGGSQFFAATFAAFEEIVRARDFGSFILSKQSAAHLNLYLEDLQRSIVAYQNTMPANPQTGEINVQANSQFLLELERKTKNCIDELQDLAKKDLEVPPYDNAVFRLWSLVFHKRKVSKPIESASAVIQQGTTDETTDGNPAPPQG